MTKPKTKSWKKPFGEALKSLGLGMSGSRADFIFEWVEKVRTQAIEEERERIKNLLDRGTDNDYEAIGMGMLDYHEKCAIDAYIAWLKNRIRLLTHLNKK